ncbi:MAG: hypothetical protein WCS32_00580 [Candidatus Izemoplasmatales bacterium]
MSKFKNKEEFFSFSKLLLVIPINEIVGLMVKNEVKLPLYVHRFLLLETIRGEVFKEERYNTYTDEQKYRLRGYDNFAIFLLEKMIKEHDLSFNLSQYKEMLLNILYLNKDALVINKGFFDDLQKLKENYSVDLENMTYDNFISIIDKVLYEQAGFLDGIAIYEWDEEMLTSYTLGDLKALGAKYDVKIPRRINKGKLVDILVSKFKLSEDEKQLLEMKSVLDLEIYARERGFRISIDLKKTDMIEYMKYALGMYENYPTDDFFDYHIPLVSDEESIVEDIIKEEVKKEAIEEVFIPEEVHDEVEEEVLIEEELPVEEPITKEEPIAKEEPAKYEEPLFIKKQSTEPVVEEKVTKPVEEKVDESKTQDFSDIDIPEDLKAEPSLADSSLLSPEEKELLDEKINQIIKKYYKRRRTRRIIWSFIILILVAAGLWAGYTYLLPLLQ